MKFATRLVLIFFVWLCGHFVVQAYNMPIFNSINGWRHQQLAQVMVWFTAFAEGHLAILLVILFYRNRRAYLWSMLPGMLVVVLVVSALKIYFADPRPPAILSEKDFFLGSRYIVSNSFPSGHSASAMMVSFFFFSTAQKMWQKIFFLSWAFLGGISRIHIGVHFPMDVWHGWMIAFTVMFITLWAIEKKAWFVIFKNTLAESLTLNMVGLFTTISFLFLYHEKEPLIQEKLIFLFSLFLVYFSVRTVLEIFVLVRRKILYS